MSEETLHEQDLESSTDSQTEGTGEKPNDTPEGNKKNTSNFKKMSKKYKEAKAEIARLKALHETDFNDDWEEIPSSKWESEQKSWTENSDLELRVFWIENPWAKEHLSEITKIAKNHNMNLDQAWNYFKATKPKESESYDDFWGSKKKSQWDIDYKFISLDESAKLSPEERAEWRKVNNFWK